MLTKITLLLSVLLVPPAAYVSKVGPAGGSAKSGPTYTASDELNFPEHYREWVYLTSGIDMSYTKAEMTMDHSMFDNVFVNPEAYKAFVNTGTWPDKTMLVLEVRKAQTEGSINHKGHYQNSEVMGLEVHVKDEARFPGKWAFFGFDDVKAKGKLDPPTADCYSCHTQHGAVDTTFVQFYPTLLGIAKSKRTLSSAYLKDIATDAEKRPTDPK